MFWGLFSCAAIEIYARFVVCCSNKIGSEIFIALLESGPMGSSHATRGWGLLVATRSSWGLLIAARSPWKHVDNDKLKQSDSMAKHVLYSTFFHPLLLAELLSVRNSHLPVRERSKNTDQ